MSSLPRTTPDSLESRERPQQIPQRPLTEHPVSKQPSSERPSAKWRLATHGPWPERPRMTVTPAGMRDGDRCACSACLRDGPHEPDCPVHDEDLGACNCGREDQSKSAG